MSRLVQSPDNPVANARLFLEHHYTRSGRRVFRSYGGVARAWSGSAWPELPLGDLTAQIYAFFEHAEYKKPTPKGFKRTPFHPTKAKVANIEAAITAVAHLPGDRSMPFWIEDDDAPSDRPSPHDLIPMANGLLQVGERTLHPATPSFFCPYALPYEFDPKAPEPTRFLRLMDEYWPDDQESQDLLQEFIGYLLVPDTSQQKILFLLGPSRSGKGTISRVIRGLVGEHNVAGPTLASLSSQFGLQPLLDKPVAIIPDARLSGRHTDTVVERLLSISGEDPLTIDRKYRSAVTGPLPSRIVILSNELPQFGDSSGALANRFLILPMERSFLGKEDPRLGATLARELPGILLWALYGLERLRERGYFVQPEQSTQVLHDLVELSSPTKAFINQECILEATRAVFVDDLFEEWREWCKKNGSPTGNKQSFGRNLRSAAPGLKISQPRRDGVQQRMYTGIGLKRDDTR